MVVVVVCFVVCGHFESRGTDWLTDEEADTKTVADLVTPPRLLQEAS